MGNDKIPVEFLERTNNTSAIKWKVAEYILPRNVALARLEFQSIFTEVDHFHFRECCVFELSCVIRMKETNVPSGAYFYDNTSALLFESALITSIIDMSIELKDPTNDRERIHNVMKANHLYRAIEGVLSWCICCIDGNKSQLSSVAQLRNTVIHILETGIVHDQGRSLSQSRLLRLWANNFQRPLADKSLFSQIAKLITENIWKWFGIFKAHQYRALLNSMHSIIMQVKVDVERGPLLSEAIKGVSTVAAVLGRREAPIIKLMRSFMESPVLVAEFDQELDIRTFLQSFKTSEEIDQLLTSHLSADYKMDSVFRSINLIMFVHKIRYRLLKRRSLAVFGLKNSGKSTLVANLWDVPTTKGTDDSTKIDVFRPIQNSSFCIYDCGGHNDVSVGELATLLIQMSTTCGVVIVLIHYEQIATDQAWALLESLVNVYHAEFAKKCVILLTKIDCNNDMWSSEKLMAGRLQYRKALMKKFPGCMSDVRIEYCITGLPNVCHYTVDVSFYDICC